MFYNEYYALSSNNFEGLYLSYSEGIKELFGNPELFIPNKDNYNPRFDSLQIKRSSINIVLPDRENKGNFSSLNRRHAERNSTQAERFITARLNNRK